MRVEVGDVVQLTGRVVEASRDRIAVTIDGYNGRPIGISLKDMEVREVVVEQNNERAVA